MKSARIELPTPPAILALGLLVLALASFAARPARASYDTQGSLEVITEGGSVISREIPFGAQVDISDSETSVGGEGNTATSGYAASITGASISASTSAQNALHAPGPPPDYWFANATVSTALHDDLRFTIPAGSYPSGLYAVARVHVEGSVGASGGGAAFHSYSLFFGEGVGDSTIWPAPPVFVDIDLTAELVTPGVTLSGPTTRTVLFVASVQAHTNAPGENAQSGSSDIACQVACISVPPGVTWVSDSGVFGAPTCSAAVPGLAGWGVAALALALGGAALWIVGRRRPEVA